MKVDVNRGACCHVAGDIDFDKHNNLWLVTGDDTPAGGGNSGGFGPFNDQKTNEIADRRSRRTPRAGRSRSRSTARRRRRSRSRSTTAAIEAALEALSNLDGDVAVTGTGHADGQLPRLRSPRPTCRR